ncbi:hypothetical protein CI109_103187 [Kwoniella shandongensis]|uniref:Uncharacterized protein n=1 Tax=Kwoniella shandongensis TaxID=1734106 RepID=A0A5M6C8P6_9TREE|nr:uncharacterized protein CI109_000378 [Kwoniella shandongensis]KAA5531536.1 hypothetical protein CI109_000378 [Kwoniella shandongensis]
MIVPRLHGDDRAKRAAPHLTSGTEDPAHQDYFQRHATAFYIVIAADLSTITIICLYSLWRGPTRSYFPTCLNRRLRRGRNDREKVETRDVDSPDSDSGETVYLTDMKRTNKLHKKSSLLSDRDGDGNGDQGRDGIGRERIDQHGSITTTMSNFGNPSSSSSSSSREQLALPSSRRSTRSLPGPSPLSGVKTHQQLRHGHTLSKSGADNSPMTSISSTVVAITPPQPAGASASAGTDAKAGTDIGAGAGAGPSWIQIDTNSVPSIGLGSVPLPMLSPTARARAAKKEEMLLGQSSISILSPVRSGIATRASVDPMKVTFASPSALFHPSTVTIKKVDQTQAVSAPAVVATTGEEEPAAGHSN